MFAKLKEQLFQRHFTGDPGGNNGTVSYTGYDAVGNRTQMTSTLGAVPGGTFSYDSNDRLSGPSYDNNGNTIGLSGTTIAYDFENRMKTYGAINIVYDGDWNRVSETVGTTTKYLMDSLNPTGLPQVLDELVSGAVTRTYSYGRRRISENQLAGSTWTPSFYGYDGHGNVRFLTNAAGTATDTYQYDAFGLPIASTGTTANNFRYSGERLDSSVGLYDLRARYYNQATGRFWARDPVEGKKCCGLSFNPYIYTRDNAVNQIDPTGREVFIIYLQTLNDTIYQSVYIDTPLGQCIGSTLGAEAQLLNTANGNSAGAARNIIARLLNLYLQAAKNFASPPLPTSRPPGGKGCQTDTGGNGGGDGGSGGDGGNGGGNGGGIGGGNGGGGSGGDGGGGAGGTY